MVIGTRRVFLKASRRLLRGRMRLLLAMTLLAVPLVAGIWAFAGFAARSSRQSADTQLSSLLQSALQQYGGLLNGAASRATALAARRDVQLALLRGDRARLARLATAMPGVSFELRRPPAVGEIRSPAAVRSVEVIVGGRRVGRVVAGVTLGPSLTRRLGSSVDLPASDRLALRPLPIASGPATLTIGRARYRTVGARLVGGSEGTALLVLTPAARVGGAAARVEDRILLAGLIALASLFLLVYAVAPVIAHGRVTKRQRDQAARVLSHLGEGILLVDERGVVRLWNPAAEAITGLPAALVQGREVSDAVPGWAEAARAIPVGDERPRAATVPIELVDRRLWLSVSGVRFSDGVVYAFRDLTEERRLEQMRSDFVATVSHELRTPLASIHGAVVTLDKRGAALEPALRDRLLAIVLEQSERLSELVEEILLAAQIDSGGLRVDRQRFDAVGVARDVVAASRPRVPDGVTVGLATPSAAAVMGDPAKARHVLSNLVDNAIKYSPDGGRIDVIVWTDVDRVRLTVRDEGLGIPPNEQERIFEKFYRLDASMTRGVGGSGLGLYICRELVRRMDGRIWVSSRPGAGSSFSFELPLAERQALSA